MKAKRKTLNAGDVLAAMEEMEFERFLEPLKEALEGQWLWWKFDGHITSYYWIVSLFSLVSKLWGNYLHLENKLLHYVALQLSWWNINFDMLPFSVYKKGQKGKKEVSEQKRKDKEKKNSEIDKSREEEEEEEEERMLEEPEEEEDVESWASESPLNWTCVK